LACTQFYAGTAEAEEKNSRSAQEIFQTIALLGKFQGAQCVNFRLWNNYSICREYWSVSGTKIAHAC